jgi:hypothetical protein
LENPLRLELSKEFDFVFETQQPFFGRITKCTRSFIEEDLNVRLKSTKKRTCIGISAVENLDKMIQVMPHVINNNVSTISKIYAFHLCLP